MAKLEQQQIKPKKKKKGIVKAEIMKLRKEKIE